MKQRRPDDVIRCSADADPMSKTIIGPMKLSVIGPMKHPSWARHRVDEVVLVPTLITPSSLPLAHPAECHPIFGNDGTLYYTRHLNCISYFTYRYFWFNTIVSLRQLLYCIFYGPTALLFGLK